MGAYCVLQTIVVVSHPVVNCSEIIKRTRSVERLPPSLFDVPMGVLLVKRLLVNKRLKPAGQCLAGFWLRMCCD